MTARLVHIRSMPRYSFTLEASAIISAIISDTEATEDLADNHAAMESARLIAKDLARNNPARDHYRVVVRDEAGNEIGNVPLLIDRR